MQGQNEGWGWKSNCSKRHYFVDGRSLCGLWGIGKGVDLGQGYDDIPENCQACKIALAERRSCELVKIAA